MGFNFSSNSVGGNGTSVLTFQNDGADGATDVFRPRFSGTGFTFANPIAIQNGAVGLTVLESFNSTGTQTFSGDISGTGGFNRSVSSGSGGTTILSGTNTYSGPTTINAGTLLVNGTHTGGAGYAVNSGGTLGGTGTHGRARLWL